MTSAPNSATKQKRFFIHTLCVAVLAGAVYVYSADIELLLDVKDGAWNPRAISRLAKPILEPSLFFTYDSR